MADFESPVLPPPTAEQRRVAAGQFERANQVIRTGNFDYGIQLLLTCCRLDPANLVYRQALRQAEKVKYKNNLRGSPFAKLTTASLRLRLRRARAAGNHIKVLEHGEQILTKNPWDPGIQVALAEAFDAIGLLNPAIWSMEQARQMKPKSLPVARALARLYERRGNFSQAAALWEQVRKAAPTDLEAQRKAKDLAASETIARGRYEEAITGTAEEPAAETAEQPDAESESPGPRVKAEATPPATDRVSRQADALRAKVEAEPANAMHLLQLAGLYRRAGRVDEARQVLHDGLVPTANNFEVAIELADLDIESFRGNLAVTEQKLHAQPDDPDLRKLRTRLLKEIYARELDLFRRKAERYPTDMSHRFEMGVRLLRTGQIDEAIRELQTARTDPRQHWRALLYLGYCFKARNNWRLAQRNFEEALRSLPAGETVNRKDLLFELAQGHATAGEMEKAVELGFELANLDFSYKGIGKLLDEWQTRLHQLGTSQD
jgi:tetratricopeptide (TPR) repeat protein